MTKEILNPDEQLSQFGKGWCAGYNAGYADARSNVYHKRFFRVVRYWWKGVLDPSYRYDGWRWWRFWPNEWSA